MEYVVAKTKAVSLKTRSTYPKIIMRDLGFYIGKKRYTRVRLQLPTEKIF